MGEKIREYPIFCVKSIQNLGSSQVVFTLAFTYEIDVGDLSNKLTFTSPGYVEKRICF